MKNNYLKIEHVPYENLTMGEESTFYHAVEINYLWIEFIAQILSDYL